MPEFTLEDLKGKTLEQLATLEERYHPLSAEAIIIREARGLLNKPSKPWHETFIGKVVVSVLAGIIVLFLTLLITKHFISTPEQPINQKASTQGTTK
jgi:hypothetical protein